MEKNNGETVIYVPKLMTNLIRRQAIALKDYLLKALLAIQPVFVTSSRANDAFQFVASDKRAGGLGVGYPLLIVVALMAGWAHQAHAGSLSCRTDFGGLVDGNDPATVAKLNTQPSITIDTNCTFENFPWPNNTLNTQVVFDPNSGPYFAIFNNVYMEDFNSGFSCGANDHMVWFANGSVSNVKPSCIDFFIPIEAMIKKNPKNQTTAAVGVPFTYTLKVAGLYFPAAGTTSDAASPNTIGNVQICDDLTAAGTGINGAPGAELTYVSNTAYRVRNGVRVESLGPLNLSAAHPDHCPLADGTKHVFFSYVNNTALESIPAGDQIEIELTVVADSAPAGVNLAGTQFANTAKWWFARWVEVDFDKDGVIDYSGFFEPLPGQYGVTPAMSIVEPTFVVTKTSTETALNYGVLAPFTIDAQNTGGSDAWNVTIRDRLPDPTGVDVGGMCQYDPIPGLTAKIVNADGTLFKTLTPADFSLISYTGPAGSPACELSLTMANAAGPIAPSQHLVITYQSQLDSDTKVDNLPLTNVAGATSWLSSDGTHPPRLYTKALSFDGTADDLDDHQDSYTVTTALAGYYFQKTVQNLTSHANPATTAASGDTLRYKLRLFNVDKTINDITIVDQIDGVNFDLNTFTMRTDLAALGAKYTLLPSGQLTITGKPPASLNVDALKELVIEFEITLKPGLANGTLVHNQASLDATAGAITALSDDPYVNGIAPPPPSTVIPDKTTVEIQTPGQLSKENPLKTNATIGEHFTYTVTVPATKSAVPLYDVQIHDDLNASAADMRFVGARVVSGGSWALSNAGTDTFPIIKDAATGIDIPAGGQAVIEITVELLNTATNQSSLPTYNNRAWYTYNRANGDINTEKTGDAGTTLDMTLFEPAVTGVTKTWSYVSGKANTLPAVGGDVLEYVITIPNSGNSTAFDTNIVDMMPPTVSLVAGSATAKINGIDVTGFVANPTTLTNGALIWGRGNGDGSLDIPAVAGQPLVLTYQVRVVSVGQPIDNSVYVDWTSLDGDYLINPISNPSPGRERTGEGCGVGVLTPLNDYCVGPVISPSVTTIDTNAITKAASVPPAPAVLRVGDTVTYQLTVKLHEGTTSNVVVTDALPAGMQLTGPPVITTSAGANLGYSLTTSPSPLAAGTSGTLTWSFGDISNTSGTYDPGTGIDVLDELIITYVAEVIPAPAGIAHVPTIALINPATLSYIGGDPSSADPLVHDRLNATATVDARQPVMSDIIKTGVVVGPAATGGDGLAAATAYQVDIVNNTMTFRLQSCNATGLAPAYNVVITDTLPVELNEGTLTGPVVKIGADFATATVILATDYVYTAPTAANGRQMGVVLNDSWPINPGECVFVEYGIGFSSNIAPNTPWNNIAGVKNYYSLPAQSGRVYAPVSTDSVYMTNTTTVYKPAKVIDPSMTQATIGETVTYKITVPGTPMNAELNGVEVSDSLAASLAFGNATAAYVGGAPIAPFNTTQTGQLLTWNLGTIPAGQQVVITVTATVADLANVNAGDTFTNAASYTYTGALTPISGDATAAITVVEPALVPVKALDPASPAAPVAGDKLTYKITLPAQTAANSSQAFDLSVVDTLGDGLGYVAGSAQITGMTVALPLPEPSIGASGTQQTLTWAGLDIPYNTEVTITYDVEVLSSVVPGQTLSNSAVVRWTSLAGGITGERTYSVTVAAQPLTTPDTAGLTKTVFEDSYVDANAAAPSTKTDGIVRVGDTVDYQLTLNLQEGTTQNVSVTDQLPPGLVFDQLLGVATGTGILHGAVSPAPGPTGVTFALGDVVHTQDADLNDAIVITYRVRVVKDALAHQASISPITNTATLSYTGAPAGATRLQGNADITVRQPVIGLLTKTDRNGLTSPANVDVVNTTMAFRLHVCNTGAAPAYSLKVTDTLATQFDEASISIVGVSVGGAPTGNYVYTLPGRTMTFEVNDPVYPNQCVDIDYDIGFRTDFGVNQTWNNTFNVDAYWSLQAPTTLGQLYAPVALPAPFVMMNYETFLPPTKALVSPSDATIGEEVVYRIAVPGKASTAGTMYDVAITDTLDPNLQYVSATVTGVAGASNASTDTQMNIAIPQIPAGQQAVIELHARVRNVPTAQQGVDINNTASYTYATTAGGATEPALTSTEIVTVNIVEPHIASVTKIPLPTTPTAGQVVRYSVTLTASGGPDSSDVFDVTITDSLGVGLVYAGNPAVTGTGNTIDVPTITGDGSAAAPQRLVWSLGDGNADIDITGGTSVTISYDVRVLDSVLANQTLTNSVVAQWTGIDGVPVSPAYERDGSDGLTGLNNYITTPVTASVTTPNISATIAKNRTGDTYVSGDANVRIGDIVEYELRVTVPEGTLGNLVLEDTLPQGLKFEGTVSINTNTGPAPFAAVAPFTHTATPEASVGGDPTAGPTTVTWNLGSVTNQPNDGANDEFVIVYRARVLNNVFSHVDLGIPLNNVVNMSYDTASGRVTQTDNDTIITALQPMLSVTKSSNPVSGSTIAALNTVTYTVDIRNDGTAPAYDVVLQDIIPLGMRAGGVTMVNTYLVSDPAASLPNLTPVYNSTTGAYDWDFDAGVYMIPAGDTLRVVYSVQADAGIGAGLTLTNVAQVTAYYSFDDQAAPTSGPVIGVREKYTPTNAASTTLYTGAPPTKTLVSPANPEATIGQEVVYQIKVPGTLSSNALYNVQITDALDPNLQYVSAAVTGVSGASNTSTDTQMNIAIPQIPAGQQAVIELHARVRNVLTAQQSVDINNSVSYTYANVSGGTTQPALASGVVTLNIVEPHIASITKTANNTAPTAGDIVRYTVTLAASGGPDSSDVFDVTISDSLGAGMVYAGNPAIVTGTGNTIGTPIITGDGSAAAPQKLVWSLGGGNADIDITEGTSITISYDVRVLDSVIANQTLTNSVVAQWTGIDGGPASPAYERDGSDGIGGLNDYVTQPSTVTLTARGAILASQKTVERWDPATSSWQSGATASPKDRLRYTITIQNTTDIPLSNFSLVDEIDRLNGTPMFVSGSIANVSTPAGATPAISGSTLTVTGLNIGANGTLQVVFEAELVPVITSGTVVLNQGQLRNVAGVPLGVTDDGDLTNGVGSPTPTIIASAPLMQVRKTAEDVTGDTTLLMAGDTLRYTITVQNIGTENASNVMLRDPLPANTTYVPNTTKLNGVAVPDAGTGGYSLQTGILLGNMPAGASVATISFDVVVNAATQDGTVISNQGFVNGMGASGTAFPEKPSDDPATTALDDPTLKTVVKPNGVVYNSITREPVAGVTLTLINASTGIAVPASCFNDPAQQGQVTTANGYYKFDLNFSSGECSPNADYLIQVTAAPAGFVAAPSQIIPPATTTTYSVPNCGNDADTSTPHCEAAAGISPTTADTRYYLHLTLGNTVVPEDSQIFNNHLALDPALESALSITKTSALVNVSRGQLVPYTITVANKLNGTMTNMVIVDTFPPGFKYVEGSARYTVEGTAGVNTVAKEPLKSARELRWENVTLGNNEKHTIKLLLVVSSGVSEGEYINQAQALSVQTPNNSSGVATATVRVVPDPTFDCTDVIGKVFDDVNRNGYQDAGEKGLPGVRVATARGLLITTDDHGRFHITCAVTPDENRGSNFILKVDDRTLPTGYRITTENPRVQRATRGKMMKFNFGATIHKMVRIDIANGVFEPGTTDMRIQWKPRMDLLMGELKKAPSMLRLAYMAEIEDENLVEARLKVMKQEMENLWAQQNGPYELVIETEVFWRTGAPPSRSALK